MLRMMQPSLRTLTLSTLALALVATSSHAGGFRPFRRIFGGQNSGTCPNPGYSQQSAAYNAQSPATSGPQAAAAGAFSPRNYPVGSSFSLDGTIRLPNGQLARFDPTRENLAAAGFSPATVTRHLGPAAAAAPATAPAAPASAATPPADLAALRAEVDRLKKELAECKGEADPTQLPAGGDGATPGADDGSLYGVPPATKPAEKPVTGQPGDDAAAKAKLAAEAAAAKAKADADALKAKADADAAAAAAQQSQAEREAAIAAQTEVVRAAEAAMLDAQARLKALEPEHRRLAKEKNEANAAVRDDTWYDFTFKSTREARAAAAENAFARIESQYRPLYDLEINLRNKFDAESAKLRALSQPAGK